MVRTSIGMIVAIVMMATGVALALGPSPSEPQPVVGRSDATGTSVVEPAELRRIYDESMRQLRECIDDRRRDPSTVGVFPC